MKFIQVIIENIPNLNIIELEQLKTAIDEYLIGDNDQVIISKLIREEKTLEAIKYYKDKRNCDLITAKNYVFELRKIIS